MALSITEQTKYWGIGLVVAIFALWLLNGVLLPFLTGMAIAYFLDPIADRLQKMGLSRIVATITITTGAVLVCILLAIILLPELIQQLISLVGASPDYAQKLQTYLTTKFPSLMDQNSMIRQSIDSFVLILKDKSGDFASVALASAFSIVDAIIFIIITPVVAFYMLLDWDKMIATIDNWLPRDHLDTLRNLGHDINGVLAGFVRGQMTVCVILGSFYAITLVIAGLQFGLIVGIVAGMLTFIPYIGSVIGGILAIGLAIFQFWDSPGWIGVIAIIFIVGQIIEGNILTPKLVGNSIGLHPVWLMFSLSAFGALMGLTGMLIAVPVAACLGVFFRFGINHYLRGRLYTGIAGKENG